MKKNNNKYLIILTTILVALVIIIILLSVNLKNKTTFVKPKFDLNTISEIPENLDYKSSILNVNDGYSIYINASPIVDNDNLIIDFISMSDNNIWIKVRILNSNDEIIAETGLVKPGEYLRTVELNKSISKGDAMTYMIMGYEKDSYLSAGLVKLNTRIGE